MTVEFPEAWKPTFEWIFYGHLGVRAFFVISGLLITWLMLCESERNGSVNLKNFFARRALRILPVYAMFLGVVGLLQAFTEFKQSRGQWIANLTFTTGLLTYGEKSPWTTGHLWSLAVEEQFYILWPVVFVILMLATRWRLSAAVLITPCVVAVICNVANHQKMYPAALQFLMGPRTFAVSFDALAVGCGAAILLFRQGPAAHRFLSLSPILTGFVALMCVIVPHVFGKLHILGPLIVPFGQTLQACGIAGLILQSIVKPGWGLYRLLNTSILVWIGTLSYSLYIWQQLFCSQPRSFGWPDVWWMSFPGWFIPAFITACASYYLLERPLMGLRSRFRS